MTAKKATRRRTHLPSKMPCGCSAVATHSDGGVQVKILADGTRRCDCGRKWRLAWVPVGEEKR